MMTTTVSQQIFHQRNIVDLSRALRGNPSASVKNERPAGGDSLRAFDAFYTRTNGQTAELIDDLSHTTLVFVARVIVTLSTLLQYSTSANSTTWKHFINAPRILRDLYARWKVYDINSKLHDGKKVRQRERKREREGEGCNLRGPWRVSETAINYVRAEAPGIRVAGLLKLKGTFVSSIVAESSCLVSFAGQVTEERRQGCVNSQKCRL